MKSGEGRYPEYMPFPEYRTVFGSISFDFSDFQHSFIIVFTPYYEYVNDKSLYEGSFEVITNPDDFDIHKEKLLRAILALISMPHKSGAELQKQILVQLRLDFSERNVAIDQILSNILEP